MEKVRLPGMAAGREEGRGGAEEGNKEGEGGIESEKADGEKVELGSILRRRMVSRVPRAKDFVAACSSANFSGSNESVSMKSSKSYRSSSRMRRFSAIWSIERLVSCWFSFSVFFSCFLSLFFFFFSLPPF